MKRLSIGYRHSGEGPGGGVPLPVTAFWDNFVHNGSSGACTLHDRSGGFVNHPLFVEITFAPPGTP